MQVQSLAWEDPLEEGMATHSSILAWRTPWMEEPSGLFFTPLMLFMVSSSYQVTAYVTRLKSAVVN